jgi:hypothetical protein
MKWEMKQGDFFYVGDNPKECKKRRKTKPQIPWWVKPKIFFENGTK